MKKKLNNHDLLFGIALIFCILFLGMFAFAYPFSRDEAYYLTVPLRLVNGDSLVQHDWHLTQFSSLFSYLPTLIWIKLTGSTEGIVVFSRCVYLMIQASLTTVVYLFFRNYKIWSVIAAVLFFTQSTNVMPLISYHTMLVSFLLLLTLSLVSIHRKSSVHLYIFAGIIYGLCCICDPGFCLLFVIYLGFCILWKYRIKRNAKNDAINQNISVSATEDYNCFFTAKAVFCIIFGILTVAAVAISFFFLTGGTIPSLINNINNLLTFSEYKIQGSVFSNLITKIVVTFKAFSSFSFHNTFLIIILFAILFIDKNRTKKLHRCVYLLFAFILATIYAVGAFKEFNSEIYFVEFPFFIFSSVCYILTKNKNKNLFRCMWIPGAVAVVFHFLSSNSLLSAISIILIINNTAGVFFVADLFNEIKSQQTASSQNNKSFSSISRLLLVIALFSQLVLHLSFYQYGLFNKESSFKATEGPYSGIYMTDIQFDNYTKSINDLDLIKNRADDNSPIYIASYQSSWMYIYADLPFGTYTGYYFGIPSAELFFEYYKENPDRVPEYIYIDYLNYNQNYDYNLAKETVEEFSKIFGFTEEELSNGILLTVTEYKLASSYENNQFS